MTESTKTLRVPVTKHAENHMEKNCKRRYLKEKECRGSVLEGETRHRFYVVAIIVMVILMRRTQSTMRMHSWITMGRLPGL